MRLMKTIRMMGLLTVFALIYIHMQMQIVDMAYQGKKKQRELEDLANSNAVVSFDIMKLTSSFNLGARLLNDNSELRFRDQDNVVEVAATSTPLGEAGYSRQVLAKPNSFMRFLSTRSEAEAKTTEDTRFRTINPHR